MSTVTFHIVLRLQSVTRVQNPPPPLSIHLGNAFVSEYKRTRRVALMSHLHHTRVVALLGRGGGGAIVATAVSEGCETNGVTLNIQMFSENCESAPQADGDLSTA